MQLEHQVAQKWHSDNNRRAERGATWLGDRSQVIIDYPGFKFPAQRDLACGQKEIKARRHIEADARIRGESSRKAKPGTMKVLQDGWTDVGI